VRTIEHLVSLMSKHELSEIDLRQGELCIRLRRRSAVPIAAPRPMAEAPPPAEGSSGGKPPESPSRARQLIEIKSPAVGTFYAQEKPGSPPYVTVGSRVMPSTVVCQIEAMKIFNEIQAECSGVIVEVLVKNKDFVEFDTVLFRVDPAA
jgi:acetyl-CoA carboxylase biotin carboxyl carrier protein